MNVSSRAARRAFTLVELMIAISIIAILAAMALPSLTRSRIAANETAAAAGLRTLVTVEATVRQGDADRNTIADWWTADVSGFYRLESQMVPGNGMSLIDVALAQADEDKQAAGAAVAGAAVPGAGLIASGLIALPRTVPKSGYFLSAMLLDVNGAPLETDPDANGQAWTHGGVFGFQARPDIYDSTGIHTYIVNEAGVIYARNFGTSALGNATAWPATNPVTVGWRVVQ